MIGPPSDLPGLAPGGRASPRAWGKFKRHFWGRSLRYQQPLAFRLDRRPQIIQRASYGASPRAYQFQEFLRTKPADDFRFLPDVERL